MAQKIYDICIVGGLGHVGLPLGISFAKSGKKVVLYDINPNTINMVMQGKMPFMETGAEEDLKQLLNTKIFLSNNKQVISESHFTVICIGTPVDEHLNPKFIAFKKFFYEILDFIEDGSHIVLRSTVFPGTTEKLKEYLESSNKKVKISFCPERIAEGKAMEELRKLPQIVAAFDEDSLKEARDLFSLLAPEIITLKPIEAELAKLFTNVWRYIQFAISNQFYQIAIQNDLDFYRIYEAMTYHYPRTQGLPRAGFAAGPCLFKDTMQLASFSNNSFFLGHAAMLINEGLPNIIVQKLKYRYPLKEKIVGILGMAFKGDSDDPRDSLSYKLKKILEIEAKEVLCTDPFIKENSFLSLDEVLSRSDVLVIGAPHTAYRTINVDSSTKVIVDIWNLLGKGGCF
jgi:UDP-N-acetyl-D-mannosaminuronic acid dehydrogenase